MTATPKAVQLKDGIVWRVAFRLKPGGAPTTETFDDPEAAWAFTHLVDKVGGAAARAARNASDNAGTTIPTLREATEKHLTLLGSSATPGTITGYRRIAEKTFLPRMGTLPITAISEEAVAEWIAWQRDQPTRGGTYSPKSLRNAQGLLSSILQRHVGKAIATNPAKGIKLPTDQQRREPVFLSPNQFTAIHAHVAERHKLLVSLLYGTGLRWGEVTALTPSHLSLDEAPATVRVARSWKQGANDTLVLGSPKTKRSLRTVTLPLALVKPLREHTEGMAPDALLFSALNGKPLRTGYFHTHVWKPAVRAAGLGVAPTLHDLRHSHASWLIAQGTPLPVIQRRLGHESITTTVNVYGHLSPDAYGLAADVADLALAQAYPQLES